MTAGKAYLVQIMHISRLIARLESMAEDVRRSAAVHAPYYGQARVQTTPPRDPLGLAVAKSVDLEHEIASHLARLAQRKLEAFGLVMRIPDVRQRDVLLARYFQGRSWDEIVEEQRCARSTVLALHREGIEAFDALYACNQG